MYKYRKLLALTVVLASLLSITTANARENTKYFGFGLGTASWDLTPLNGSFELEDDTVFRAFMGQRTGNTGFEGEIASSSHDWKGSGGQATHNAFHLIVSGIGFQEISSSIELYGKIGLNIWSTDVDLLGTNYEGESGVGIALAGGVDFAVSKKVHLRAEYQILSGLEDGIDEGDISQFTVNAVINY